MPLRQVSRGYSAAIWMRTRTLIVAPHVDERSSVGLRCGVLLLWASMSDRCCSVARCNARRPTLIIVNPNSCGPIMYFASRAASPRNPKELLDRAAKGDERGRRSDPRQ